MRKIGNRHKAYNEVEKALGNDSYKHKNGVKTCVSKVSTKESRSKGGKTRVKQNKESGYWVEMTQKYSSENGKKNIKHCHTKQAKEKQKQSASYIIEQLSIDGKHIKFWYGTKSFKGSIFNYNSIKSHITNNTPYKNYIWKLKKASNKKHRKSQLTKDKIKFLAKECSYKAQFKQRYSQAYYMAKELGIFELVTKHMKRPKAKNQYTK